jgi:hypothetical protein
VLCVWRVAPLTRKPQVIATDINALIRRTESVPTARPGDAAYQCRCLASEERARAHPSASAARTCASRLWFLPSQNRTSIRCLGPLRAVTAPANRPSQMGSNRSPYRHVWSKLSSAYVALSESWSVHVFGAWAFRTTDVKQPATWRR